MIYTLGKQDMRSLERAQEHSFLLTNGLGGYCSLSAAFSAPRCDQGLLVAAVKAPNERVNMVHRLSETLTVGGRAVFLSSQQFADGTPDEDGWRHLTALAHDAYPTWRYHVGGVDVDRCCVMGREENTVTVLYRIVNHDHGPCTLRVEPFLRFTPKEDAVKKPFDFTYNGGTITANGRTLYLSTNGEVEETEPRWQALAYPEDEKDGRPGKGLTGSCCAAAMTVRPGEAGDLAVVFSMDEQAVPTAERTEALLDAERRRQDELAARSGFRDPFARQLARSADAFIARRDSTGGKTILAGYPRVSDWGRDTMIALPGCTLSTGRFEDAKSILRTFLAYEKDGLVPNLFPEGEAKPMYNTVDAALLLIDCVWQYHQRTGDLDFVKEAWPVMERIIAAYRKGTRHSIAMDSDGLIAAGGGLDQVTWMDVCVNGILPTPRHGKPVEINAYWYNALRIMARFAPDMGGDAAPYAALAQRVKASFVEKFYMEDKGYLKDVISGTSADEQLRCNQIWAVSMPFTMLSPEQERNVVDAVRRHLWTPCGLRTLSPEDPEYHPTYGGDQVKRDMAYHQGTTWVFPMGAYYLARLKVCGNSPEAVREVREALLAPMHSMLREGCLGQLPEIYDGDCPNEGKGCFAQAWSVGEMLRVYEALEGLEEDGHA